MEISNPARELSSVQVALEPVVYANLPSEAFPNEQPKVATVETTGVESEVLSTYFTDLKGGREYDVKATLADLTSRIDEKTQRTVYVREFENIANLDRVWTGAHYFAWHASDSWVRNYGKTTIHTPLLGPYASKDVTVFDKHVDWATGNGVDFFIFQWADPNNWTSVNLRDNILRNSKLLNRGEVRFCLTYDLDVSSELGRLRKTSDGRGTDWFNYGFDMADEYNIRIFLEDFAYLSQFFNHPQYMRIDDRPLLFIYGAMKLRSSQHVLEEVRGRYHPFLAGQLVAWYPAGEIGRRVAPLFPFFDAVYAFNMVGGNPGKGDGFIRSVSQQFVEFEELARRSGTTFFPHVEPGYNDCAIRGDCLIVERSPQFLRKYCEMSAIFLDPKIRILLISTFNEWNEDSQVEPSADYKEGAFAYLEVIRDCLAGT